MQKEFVTKVKETYMNTRYRATLRGKPDVLVVHSAGIVQEKSANGSFSFRSTTYAPADDGNGGFARIAAAKNLAQVYQDIPIVTCSHSDALHTNYQNEPSHAAVMAEELATMGVPKERIILQEKSTSTQTELREITKLAIDRDWKRIAFITNSSFLHTKRAKLMWKHPEKLGDAEMQQAVERFKKAGGKAIFVGAEYIVTVGNKEWKKTVRKYKKTDIYKVKKQREKRGMARLKSGMYGVDSQKKF